MRSAIVTILFFVAASAPGTAQTSQYLQERAAAETAFEKNPKDPDVIKHYATVMDVFGNKAAEAYYKLALMSPIDAKQALDRGFFVGLRDGDADSVAKIEAEMKRRGTFPPFSRASRDTTSQGLTIVPGGKKALALAAGLRADVPAGFFALEYSQTLAARSEGSDAQQYIERLHRYFLTLEGLKKKMTVTPDGLETVLDARTLPAYRATQNIFSLLGWSIEGDVSGDPSNPRIDRIRVTLGTDVLDSERQIYTNGFGLDFFAAKKALEEDRLFQLRVPYERLPIAVNEDFWFRQVMKVKPPAGGMFEALRDYLPAARFYVAFASLTPETQQQLLQAFTADKLTRNYADELAVFGASISVRGGRCEVPGGAGAAMVWEKLAGANPAQPSLFLKALLQKDGGKLLGYFSELSELPQTNQQFFTHTYERLSAFYTAYPFSEKELLSQHKLIRTDLQFSNIARELPLDANGMVVFPGGVKPWAVNTEDPDQVLVGLLSRKISESFLFVVSLEREWGRPIDEASIQLLVKNYTKYRSIYPYFFSLPLGAADLNRFFNAVDGIDALGRIDRVQVDDVMGQFHGVVSLLTILSDNGGISADDAARILANFCVGLSIQSKNNNGAKNGYSDYTAITIETLKQVVVAAVGGKGTAADERLLNAIAGKEQNVSFKSAGKTWTVNRSVWQKDRIRTVLAAQTASSIQSLIDIHDSLLALDAGSADASPIVQLIERQAAGLREITPAPEDRLSVQDRAYLIKARPSELTQLIADLRDATDQRRPQAIHDIVGKISETLAPFLKTTLLAWSYAYYSSPNDLVIARDSYWVRRHRFIPETVDSVWADTSVRSCEGTAGICVSGGLAQLGQAAGNWGRTKIDASAGLRFDGFADLGVQAELSAIRTVPWSQIKPEAVHLVGVQLRAGREIVVCGAAAESVRESINEHLVGLVGSLRRLEVFRALSEADPSAALDILSSSDLYFLAESMRDDVKAWGLQGPLFEAFTATNPSTNHSEAKYFGGSHPRSLGEVRPDLIQMGPYENYERLARKDQLWETASHSLLNIAEAADREGVPTDALAMLAEAALHEFGANVHMRDANDWMSVVQAMNRVSLLDVLPELTKHK